MAALRRFAVPTLALLTVLTLIGAQATTARLPGGPDGSSAGRAVGAASFKEVVGPAITSSPRAHIVDSTAADGYGSAQGVQLQAEVVDPGVANSARAAKANAQVRAPSIGGIDRRESALASTLRLHKYTDILTDVGPIRGTLSAVVLLGLLFWAAHCFFSPEMLITILYCILYLIASPMAIMANKVLMKDLVRLLPFVLLCGLGARVARHSATQSQASLCISAPVAFSQSIVPFSH
jgi:hypothetical protein